jgi:hypothetical protein
MRYSTTIRKLLTKNKTKNKLSSQREDTISEEEDEETINRTVGRATLTNQSDNDENAMGNELALRMLININRKVDLMEHRMKRLTFGRGSRSSAQRLKTLATGR